MATPINNRVDGVMSYNLFYLLDERFFACDSNMKYDVHPSQPSSISL